MVHSEAEDAGGLSPAKVDNEAMRHFIRRTLPILGRVDYITFDMEGAKRKDAAALGRVPSFWDHVV